MIIATLNSRRQTAHIKQITLLFDPAPRLSGRRSWRGSLPPCLDPGGYDVAFELLFFLRVLSEQRQSDHRQDSGYKPEEK
jgi:hypothetical protein